MRERYTGALRLSAMAAIAAAGLALAACGSSNDSSPDTSGSSGGGDQFSSSGLEEALGAVADKEGSDNFGVLKIQITSAGTEFQIRDGEQAHGYVYTTSGDLQDEDVQIVGSGSLEGSDFPSSDIDTAAVDKIIPDVEQQVGADDATVTVMTLERGLTDGQLKWTINAEGGGRTGLVYTADPGGGNVSNPVGDAVGKAQDAAGQAQKQAQPAIDVAQCIQDAGSNVDKIQACTE